MIPRMFKKRCKYCALPSLPGLLSNSAPGFGYCQWHWNAQLRGTPGIVVENEIVAWRAELKKVQV